MTDMLKLIRANHVSAVVTESFQRSIDIAKEILKEKSRIWMCFPDRTTVLTTYNRFKDENISVDYVKEKGNYKDSDVVLSTSDYVKKMLYKYFENGKITVDSLDFCDILVLGGVSLWKNNEMIIMNLWKNILTHKREIKVPRVVLSLFNLDIDNSIPFDLSQSYYYIDGKEDVKIFYHDKDIKLSDKNLVDNMYDVIKDRHENEDLHRPFMIYCPGFKEVVSLTINLRKLDNTRLFFLTKDLDKENADKLYNMSFNGNRLIVVSSPILTPVKNISIVFDCMIERDEYKTPNESIRTKTSYISKALATQRSLIASDYCYRFCTEQKYESLKSQPMSESSRIPVTRMFLELVDRGLDPKTFFGDSLSYVTVREEIMELTKTKMIKILGKDVIIDSLGEFFLALNISRYPSILLHRWMMNEQQVFPGIVLACIIDKADGMFFYIPDGSIEEKKQYFIKVFEKWASSSIIETYLNMWKSYSDDIGDLKPTKEQLKEWCKSNSVNFKTFDMLLDSIVETYDTLEYYKRKPITIGKFLPERLLIRASEMIESVYASKIFQVTDADKLRYIDSSHSTSFLDVQRHFNPYVKIPYRLVSFSNFSFMKDKKEIRKIVLFHPLNNKFVKGKYLEPKERPTYKVPPKPVKETYDMFPVYETRTYPKSSYSSYSPEYLPPSDDKPSSPEYLPHSPEYLPYSPEYKPSSPEYLPPPDDKPSSPEYRAISPEYRAISPEYRAISPEYKPPPDDKPSTPFVISTPDIQEEQFTVKQYNVDNMKRVVQFYSKSKDIQDIGDDIPSNWRKILSNFYPHPITMNGKSYYSVEHYYHAAKAMYSNKPEKSQTFEVGGSVGPDPLDAKRAGGKARYKQDKDILDFDKWNKNKDRVMYEALVERERTDKMFSKILERTKEMDLYLLHFERSGLKSYWGGSYKEGNINGENILGRLMMMLRDSIETSFEEEEEPKSAPARDILDQEEEEARLFREAFDDLSL